MPQQDNSYITHDLGDGTFEKYAKPMTYKVPDEIKYVEHTDSQTFVMPIPKDTEGYSEKYKALVVEKIRAFDPGLAFKHCKDCIVKTEDNYYDWNLDRLFQLDINQVRNVYTLVSNANSIALTNPSLL